MADTSSTRRLDLGLRTTVLLVVAVPTLAMTLCGSILTTWFDTADHRWAVIGGGALLAMLMSVGITAIQQRLIVQPITALAEVARAVTMRNDFSLRAACGAGHELGQLADSFNALLAHVQKYQKEVNRLAEELEERVVLRTADLECAKGNLEAVNAEMEQAHEQLRQEMRQREQLQAQLLDASRQAGMAEIATGVLHNVGNVLNSINVSATLLEEHLHDGKLDNVRKIAGLLEEQSGDLPGFFATDRGRQLPTFVAGLAEYLLSSRDKAQAEAGRLLDRVAHVKQVVSSQQAIARNHLMEESVRLPELVEEALHIQMATMQKNGVEVVRDWQPVPEVVTDKHLVLQILVNLFSNACKALRHSENPRKQITVRLGVVAREAAAVFVEVVDNGVGIEPNQLTRIFSYGFSAWEGGHGFGLHACANAAGQLHGELTVASDGRGRGARFRLELPVQVRQTQEAAA